MNFNQCKGSTRREDLYTAILAIRIVSLQRWRACELVVAVMLMLMQVQVLWCQGQKVVVEAALATDS